MEKVVLNKQRMYSSTRTVLKKYSEVWGNSVPFKTSFTQFIETFGKTEGKELAQKSSKGVTKEKKQALDNMLDIALIVCGGGLAYANIVNNKNLGEAFNFSKSSLKLGKDKEIYKRCKLIAESADTIKDKLGDYNVSIAQVKLLGDAVKDYYDIINAPRDTRQSSKTSKEEMMVLHDECDRILEEVIDKLMLTYKASQPDFYLEYSNARVIGGWRKKKDEEEPPVV